MIEGINHITLAVKDLDESFIFYKELLEFKPLAKWAKGAYFLAGDMWFCIIEDKNLKTESKEGYSHIALSINEENFIILSNKIKSQNIRIWQENTSEGNSLYFLDPNGHKLELHTTRWQDRLKATNLAPYENMEFF